MGERTEFWANVQVYGVGRTRGALVGGHWKTRQGAEDAASLSYLAPLYRIHVRLKPEGAPKRYADETERYFWERAPNLMRSVA